MILPQVEFLNYCSVPFAGSGTNLASIAHIRFIMSIFNLINDM